MTKLSHLRARLARLRRRRHFVRLVTGLCALGVAIAWTLTAVFLADWLASALGGPVMEMTRAQRAVLFAVAGGGLLWAISRFVRPWLGHRETLIDMALLVQRQRQIDSDLVAALQFEDPEARQWGSVQLEGAVVDHMAEEDRRLRFSLGLPVGQAVRRLGVLTLTIAALGAAVWQFPEHASVFVNRLFLGSQHYPTSTRIERVAINGQPIELMGGLNEPIRTPYGQAIRFEVVCAGSVPSEGWAVLTSESGGGQSRVTLSPANHTSFQGELPRLVDAAVCRVYAGDAWTDPVRLVVAPPPLVDVELDVTAPGYAASGTPAKETVSGLRQLAVAEGSRVQVRVLADKPLDVATIALEGTSHSMTRASEPASEGRRETWTLGPESTPLAAVVEPVRYSIQVKDIDGLALERPIEGMIRIKADQPPQVFGSTLTQLVLPAARPTISFAASDDYGLTKVVVAAEVVHADGSSGEKSEQTVYELPKNSAPRKSVQDRYRLPLGPLKAVKGDQVKITLRAQDYRGSQDGKPGLSEPLILQVTDQRGIYAAMADSDRESIRQLQTMIDNQIDVGEEK